MKNCAELFVCLGNICRSPTAHGVFRHMVAGRGLSDVVTVDSAGTHNYHPNSPPDARSQAHAAKRGYDISDLKAHPNIISSLIRAREAGTTAGIWLHTLPTKERYGCLSGG